MSRDDEFTDYISTQLRVEKRPVTAVSMSRNFDISTKEAANIIELFFQLHKEDSNYEGLNARYSICGDSKEKVYCIQLVDYTKLEETKNQLFSNVSNSQLYSIQLVNDSTLLANVNLVNERIVKPYNKENMIKWGIIFTESEEATDLNDSQLNSARLPVATHHSEPVTEKLDSQVSKNTTLKYATKPEQAKEEPTKSRYVSRKTSTPSAPVKPKTEYVSRKRKSGIIVDNVASEEEDSVDVSMTKKTKLMTQEERELLKQQEEKLKVLFEDDDFSDDEAEKNGNEKQDMIEDIDVVENDVDKEIEHTKPATPQMESFFSKKTEETEPTAAEPQEPQDDIPEFQTVTDADGFITTKRNVKRPAQTSSTSSLRSKGKALPDANSPSQSFKIETKKTGPKKQASLMNFFKKKT